jgi:hypothetical protein
MGVQVGMGNFASAMACNFYRKRDAPRFIIGRKLQPLLMHFKSTETQLHSDAMELMFVGIGMTFVAIALLSYTRINRKRDALEKAELESGNPKKYTGLELQMMADRAPDFRYTL